MRTADTVIIDMVNEPKRAAMIHAVAADPAIVAMAATWPDMLSRPREALAQTPEAKTTVPYKMVGPEYLGILDIPIVRGRNFADHERTAPVAVISETTARTLFPASDAIGQVNQLDADPNSPTRNLDDPPLPSRSFTVVGISRDVRGFRIMDSREPGVFVPASTETPETSLMARVKGDPELLQTARPVGFGLLAGAGLALALATVLIASPMAGAIAEVVHVTDPLAYSASLLLIIAACLLAAAIPAARASRLEPMQTLRQD